MDLEWIYFTGSYTLVFCAIVVVFISMLREDDHEITLGDVFNALLIFIASPVVVMIVVIGLFIVGLDSLGSIKLSKKKKKR